MSFSPFELSETIELLVLFESFKDLKMLEFCLERLEKFERKADDCYGFRSLFDALTATGDLLSLKASR